MQVHANEAQLFKQFYDAIIRQEHIDYIGLILQRAAQLYPKSTALECSDKNMSYHDLYYHACQLSIKLKERGVKQNDRVLLLFENSIEFYVAYFGILQIGAIAVPVNTFLHERELVHIIKDAAPVLFICSSSRSEKLAEFSASLPPMIDEKSFELERHVPELLPPFEVARLAFDAMAVLLYTSGTTGFPKGVMLSSRNMLTNVMQLLARFGMIRQERVFAVLPLFHSFAQNICIWASIIMGCTVIVVPKIERRALLDGLERKPTIFLGVPALFGILSLLKTAPVDSVIYFISGGDALPDKIRAAFSLIYRRKICSGYGTTEASPVVSADLEDVTELTNCTGTVLEGISCAIRNEQGDDLPPNHIGQLWLKGDTIMLGYYNAPEINKEAFKNGWFATGDLAYFDDRNKLVITGRIKDLIINKGIKIYPQEVENIILLDPNVMLVGVIGIDDPDVGQVPIAYVQIRHKQEGIENALKELCMQHLASYKVPRQFICSLQALPTTTTGKVDKKVLRKLRVG